MFNPSGYDGRMPYRRCGDAGLLLTEISLRIWHNFGHGDDLKEARRIMRRAFDRGFTQLDDSLDALPSQVPGAALQVMINQIAPMLKKKYAES